ncbi:MAG: 16S rRNA (cytosine(1402)-N(4))-methyltransferase RsmH [Anaerolineales bacterium]|nr:16S rRNA (cytosine(1402)-N(4))-methyltransferase RsmH [Anaerolineales bacterium]
MDNSTDLDGLPHRPVLYQEIIHALQPSRGCFYIDGTLGAGGHAWGILQASSPDGLLLGLDVDTQALELARQRLAPFGARAVLVQASYTTLRVQMERLGWAAVDGIVLDLGLSSIQLDTAGRGFSFQADAPLDMRFDLTGPLRAADLVNELPEDELARLLFDYGEERRARQIAQAIIRSRPIQTTGQLAEIVARVSSKERSSRSDQPGGRRRIHPATRTFQALRIAVNQELKSVEVVLPEAVKALKPGGRLAVISFHSLEDRIVKQFFRRESQGCLCPPRQPVCTCEHTAALMEVNRRPIQPGPSEIEQNPRSRSAKLRVVEKLPQPTRY